MAVQAPQMYPFGGGAAAGAGPQGFFPEYPNSGTNAAGISLPQNDFYFNVQPQKRTVQQPLQQQQQQQQPNMQFLQMMENHKLEVDLLVTLQCERLRWALQEQRKNQLATMVKFYESKAAVLIQQKDEEIAKGLHRMMELEQMVKSIESENLAWEKVARENEAAIISMNNTIEKLRHGEEDAESCCGGGGGDGGGEDPPEVNRNGAVLCKICNSRPSCVVLLPCRHLCSCNVCEGFIGTCPVCNVGKKASIEALF